MILSLILYITALSQTTGLQYQLLKNVRPEITVFPYTSEERTKVAHSVKNLLSIYVNRQSKIDIQQPDYFAPIDPLPGVDDIIATPWLMKDIDFHYIFVELFASLRDKNTEYTIPGVHSCVKLFKTIDFTVVGEGEDEQIVVLGNYSRTEFTRSIAPRLKIDIGDILISIDGKPIKAYLKSLVYVSRGATESSSLRNSLLYLTNMNGRYRALPIKDSNHYVFLSPITNERYGVDVPWIVQSEISCWKQAKSISEARSKTISSQKLNSHRLDSIDEHFSDYERFRNPKDADIRFDSSDNIRWAIHLPRSLNMGIISLSSIDSAASIDVAYMLKKIQSLLLNQLKDTSSIMFDVRDNFSDSIDLADKIPQFFGRNIKTVSGRAIANSINQNLFSQMINDDWQDTFDNYRLGDIYTRSKKFTNDKDANSLGQAYTKPVGVFTSGRCFSACEVFAANMQDNNIATIFGMDQQTGGSGSIPVSYSHLESSIPKLFPAVPYRFDMPSAAQDFRAAWIHFVRIDGTLIEDTGITSDIVLRPTAKDIISVDSSQDQFDKVARILNRQAVARKISKLVFEVNPQNIPVIAVGDSIIYTLKIRGYSKVLISNEAGQLLATRRIYVSSRLTQSKFKIRSNREVPGLVKYNIRAFDSDDHLSFSTWRTVKFIPRKENYKSILEGISINFRPGMASKYAILYDSTRKVGKGWTLGDGKLIIGDGRGYVKGVDTTMSYFVVSTGALVFLHGKYHTEIGNDCLSFGYIANGKTTHLLDNKICQHGPGVSGAGVLNMKFSIPSGLVEVFLHFESIKASSKSKVLIGALHFELE